MEDTQSRIVEAVGLASRPGGPRTWKLAIRHAILRPFVKFLFWRPVPLAARQWSMFKVMGLFRMRSIFGGASIGNTFENDLMKLIFNATAIANIADNAASSPLTNLSVALHTADPGETGDQTTSEVGYTSYARVSVARTSGGWTVTNNSVSPVAAISFPAGIGGSGTVTHFSVGPTGGGATKIIFSGTVTPNIVTGNGITPQLGTGSTLTID